MASSMYNTRSSSNAGSIEPLAVPAGWTFLAHKSRPPNTSPAAWPYTAADFTRMDDSSDATFYASPRFVAHIDNEAISRLLRYYAETLPQRGRILDFGSSWLSHYPAPIAAAVASDELEVLGTGLNALELNANLLLAKRKGLVDGVTWPLVRDLNVDPDLSGVLDGCDELLDAATCAVSIDYLKQPTAVLGSLRQRVKKGGAVHLILSNRCFQTKAISRWLSSTEDERLDMVADYLAFSGWSRIEVLESKGAMFSDPLWVVRGVNQE